MKSQLISALLLTISSPLALAWGPDYTETRELKLDVTGDITSFRVDAGSGFIKLVGADTNQISVTAEIILEDMDEPKDEVKDMLQEHMNLTLEQKGSRIQLNSGFDSSFFSRGFWGNNQGQIDLTIEVPKGLFVYIDDGSGSITASRLENGLEINDGSGSITVSSMKGPLTIEDGSGSINLMEIAGDVNVDDGSGSITIEQAQGDVVVDDGSGSININKITGSVSVDDGSGGIYVTEVSGNFTLIDDGSGSLKINEIAGKVSLNK